MTITPYSISLRPVLLDDLPTFFEHQRDPEGVRMAAFTAKDPEDRAAFDAHWRWILNNEDILARAILVDGALAGTVSSYGPAHKKEITYWLGREYWGRGIATAALREFLKEQTTRPLYARAAKDNVGSLRVLEKCGFAIIGEDRGYASGRGEEIEEYVLVCREDQDERQDQK